MSKSRKIEKILRSQIIKNKLETIVNEKGLELVKILLKKKQINEFKLAGKLKIKVNKVRSLLYKLYSKKIATYTRKRDKRKGWYIYTWKLDPSKLVEFTIKELKSDINVLEQKYRVKKAGKEFFACVDCSVQLDLVKALETNYTCPYCEKPLKVVDTEKVKQDILDAVDRLKNQIATIKDLA